MKLRKLTLALVCLGFTLAAEANEVLLVANQQTKITYRVVHKNQNDQPIFGELQSREISKNATISIDLNNYDKAGVIIVSANGHELPSTINQFDKPRQCSITTDKLRSTGTLEFTLSLHRISCRTFGGVFG